MADGMMRSLLALTFALYSVAVSAEELPDPTRPPAFITGTGGAPGQSTTGNRSSGLQSTIISESRRAAIIDGKTVELWAKHGNAQLIEVNEGSVVLRSAQTRQVLTLFPDVKLTPRKAFVRAPESEIKTNTATSSGNAVHSDETSTKPGAKKERK